MHKLSKRVKWIIIEVIIAVILIALFIVLNSLKNHQAICEYYTKNISNAYIGFFGQLTKNIPFSLTEVLAVILGIIVIVLFVLGIIAIFKLKILKAVSRILGAGLIVGFVVVGYFASCELAYNRDPLPVNYYEEKVESNKFGEILDYFIDDINNVTQTLEIKDDGELVAPYTHEQLNELCGAEFERIKDNDYFGSFTTNTKKMLSSFIYRELHITGVTCCLTTEANVNTLNVEAGKPFTYLHELAHTKGVMREDDAQQVALCLALSSNNAFLRYSAYYCTFGAMLDLGDYIDKDTSYSTYAKKLDYKFLLNCSWNSNYWKDHDLLADLADWWNNLYLKSSGQEEGTSSYSDQGGESDPVTKTISSFSNYQKIYFRAYYGGDLL